MPELPLVAEWQRITHRLLEELDDLTGDLQLTPGEVNALACFGDENTLAVRDLVEATAQRPSTLTGVLDRLERRGLVERRPHPADRRSLQVTLTRSGRRSASAVRAAMAGIEARLPATKIRDALRALDAALGA